MSGISGGNQYNYTPGTVPGTLQGQADKAAYDAAHRKAPSYFPTAPIAPKSSPDPVYVSRTQRHAPPARDNYGYQPTIFNWSRMRLWMGLGPARQAGEREMNVARALFGSHSAYYVRQTRLLPSGRQSYLMQDGQVIQRASYAEVPKGNSPRLYFGSSKFTKISIRAVVDALESGGTPYVFGSNDADGSTRFARDLNAALAVEKRRRLNVARHEVKSWETRIREGANHTAAEIATIALIQQIGKLLSSRKLKAEVISAAYREFEAWGESSPRATEPNWRQLAAIVGVT